MGKKTWWLSLVGVVLAGALFSGAYAAVPVPTEAPYTGVIRNFTQHDIAFYSENSQGIIVVPAKSWREYVVWHENFDLIGYVKGDPFYCKKVQVMPGQFPFNCKAYDFLAIIGEEAPTAVEGLG
jgi:hypothetical protein